MLAWHFLRNDGSTSVNVYYKPEPNSTEIFKGELIICNSGLHACKRAIDALYYAPGDLIRRVDLRGNIIHDKYKSCASERHEIWRNDASNVLKEFARWCAYSTVVSNWPDAPNSVNEWLATGDEKTRKQAFIDAKRTYVEAGSFLKMFDINDYRSFAREVVIIASGEPNIPYSERVRSIVNIFSCVYNFASSFGYVSDIKKYAGKFDIGNCDIADVLNKELESRLEKLAPGK